MKISANSPAVWRTLFEAAYRRISPARIAAAIGLAIFLHVLLALTAPKTIILLETFTPKPQNVSLVEAEKVVIPEALLPEEFRKKQEPKFVPVNPNAPQKTPPETNNHSAIDQRAAQENPDPTTRSRKPTNDGELENSAGIAENVLPRELLPESMRTTRVAPAREKPSENPTEKDVPADNPVSQNIGVNAPESDAGTVARGEKIGSPEKSADAVPDPQERPQIAPPPGLKLLTMKSNTATNEIGSVSLDAKFSEFGEYTQRMLEAIQAAWYVTCERSAVHARGSVVVSFTLCADGTVKSSSVLHSSASELATYACRDAIESRAPYEAWGEKMISLFGEEQTTTLTFHYR